MGRDFTYMRFGKGKNKIELCLELKPRKSHYAGFISSNLFSEVVTILVNDSLLEELDIRSGYITAQEDGSHPRIILDAETFNGIKRGNIATRFLLLHEIGHYSCGHLMLSTEIKDEFSRRKSLLDNNCLSKEEVEADLFAANLLGAENAIWALQEKLEQRMAFDLLYGNAFDSCSQDALKEYQLRIDVIQEHFGLCQFDDTE